MAGSDAEPKAHCSESGEILPQPSPLFLLYFNCVGGFFLIYLGRQSSEFLTIRTDLKLQGQVLYFQSLAMWTTEPVKLGGIFGGLNVNLSIDNSEKII